MEKYEYHQLILSFRDDGANHTAKLNEQGILGWELMSSIKIDEHNVCYIFKRASQGRTLLNEDIIDLLKDRN
jgi:hypothetical protein